MEPTEDEISQVLDVLGLDPVEDRTVVITALKNNGRDVQNVVLQYFDDPANFRTKYTNQWDERMFSGDRDGADNNAGISFHVEAPTQHEIIHGVNPMDGSAPGAPSRPPSRTNSKSPLGKMVDWVAPDTHNVPNSQAQEDEDMQRAIRESAQEAGIEVPAQETGVVDASTSQAYFGPANRDTYDHNNWAMVPTGPQETRLDRAPLPSARKRVPGAPAFLIQGYSNHGLNHLGGLLTILHEIPLARNILLSLGEPAATYGHNREWWNGQEILPEHVLAKIASGEIQWGEHNESLPNLEAEIHRIMAFLDSTERGYGTATVLTDMISGGRGAEKQFYETIAVRNDDKIQQLTQVAALCEIRGPDSTEEEVANFGLLEMEHPRSEYNTIKTLYESLDHVMWNDALTWNDIHEGTKMATFKRLGETLVLKVSGDGPEDSIDIPLELYPEKYLSDRKAEAGRIQAAWVETKIQAERLRQAEQTLTTWRDEWNNTTYDKKGLVKKAQLQWQTYQEYLEGLGRFRSMENSGFDTDKYPVYQEAPVQANEKEAAYQDKINEAVRVTEKLLEDIDGRLQGLKSQSQQLIQRQRFIGRLLTDPNKDRPRSMSCKKYLLRGVATTIDVIYVCRRSEPDLIDLGDTPKPIDQWWRLSRAPDQEQVVEKVEIERVLRDMWQETKTPLMVYATEDALNTPPEPLLGPLERFVKADNKAFRQELNQELDQEQSQAEQSFAPVDVVSPSKRKHRADSMDSMNSNRASIGSIDMEDRENPFVDQYDGTGPDIPEHEMEQRQAGEFGGATRARDDPFALLGLQRPEQKAVSNPREATIRATTEEVDSSTTNGTGIPTPSTSTHAGGFSRTISPDAEATRSPEMKERGRPPPFMTSTSLEGDKARTVNTMEMEVPENQD